MYFWEKGLLKRKPYSSMGKALIILPQVVRVKALKMAYNSPVAGHFGRERTMRALRERVDWPGMNTDVNMMCASCAVCQKSKPALLSKAPLHPLPIIREPFTRIAMDIYIGPLPRTKAGNKYILVVMDYSSKWPEAYAMKNTTSETVVKCLIDMTSRVGIPEELLTDNGSNFISKIMKSYCQAMGIRQIKTSPYHPQTDGMVERFNATLKTLIRKLTQNPGVEWDACLPYLLYAYRGTVHRTTGFSPYQMLFGRVMRMPLDTMVRFWKGKEESGENTSVEFVQALKSNIEVVRELALERETKEKKAQKHHYDKKAVVSEFEVGDYELVFRPIKMAKLLNQWQGPYPISKKITDVTYQVDLGTTRKRFRTFHVNSIRRWTSPAPAAFMTLDEEKENEQDEQPEQTNNLTSQQIEELQELQESFEDVIQVVPGKTDLVQHNIPTKDALPIRLPPYRLAHHSKEFLREEIATLL